MATNTLEQIYSKKKVEFQNDRYKKAIEKFTVVFNNKPQRFFSAPGRTEICGNHTDHNKGLVLAAGVSLDVIAAVAPTDDGVIQIQSEGYPLNTVNTNDLTAKDDEKNSSVALIRGVAKGFADKGYKIGGFKAYTITNVLKGSGLSSSAAFEVLVATILNGLYNDGKANPVEIAKIAQFAENKYFGKPSGLMDQMASSVGGFISIDFADTANPVINKVSFDFSHCGHALCIIDTKGNHANLTPEYAAVPREMKYIAGYFNADCLREISKNDIIANYRSLRKKFGDRAVLRALHFMDDNERVLKESAALENGKFNEFLRLINESGNSSYMYLQNVYPSSAPDKQGLSSALYIAKDILKGKGACRVHGGGFAGTIQAFVPYSILDDFRHGIENVFGKGSCHVLTIRPVGGTEVIL